MGKEESRRRGRKKWWSPSVGGSGGGGKRWFSLNDERVSGAFGLSSGGNGDSMLTVMVPLKLTFRLFSPSFQCVTTIESLHTL